MRRVATWVLIAVAAIVVLAIAALLALPVLVDTPRVQALIVNNASQALGRPVRLQSASVRVFPAPAVRIRGLEIAEDPAFGPTPFLRLDAADLRIHVWPLLAGRVEFGTLVLKQPTIAVIQAPDGRLNLATLGATRDPAAPPRAGRGAGASGAGAVLGARVRIEDGTVTYEARTTGSSASRYRVEKLDLTLAGAPGPIAVEGSARVMPGDVALKISDATLGLNGARTLADARLRGRVAVEGKKLGELAAVALGPSPALAGAVRGTLALAGTVGNPRVTGDVELSDLGVTQVVSACPEPKRRTLALGPTRAPIAWEETRLTARPLTSGIAAGTITTNLTASLARGLHVELADLGIRGLPMDKLLVDHLCQGYAVSGPLDLTGHAALQPADIWRTLGGAGQLRIGPGKVVGAQALKLLADVTRLGGAVSAVLGADLPPSTFSAPLDFESITATYTITDGVVKTPDLLYDSKALKMAAAGTYALASGAVNMDATLTHARGSLKAKISGTAAAPAIRVDTGSLLQNVKPGEVEKGLRDLLKRFR